jgi:hypothetical protein
VSFSAAAILIPTGAFTFARAWRHDRRYAALAALPMLLGVQQFAEGMIWIAGARGDTVRTELFSVLYMFFAWVGWPSLVPVAVYFTEPPRRHGAYLVFAMAGAMLGGVQWLPYLVHSGWLEVRLLPRAVRYSDTELLDAIITRPATYLAYVTILIAPLLLASDRRIKVFGLLVAAVLAITVAFFQWAYISVFCFGGAVVSAYLLWALRPTAETEAAAA